MLAPVYFEQSARLLKVQNLKKKIVKKKIVKKKIINLNKYQLFPVSLNHFPAWIYQ